MPAYEWQEPLTPEKLHRILSTHPAFNNPLVAIADATISLSEEKHDGRILLFDRAAGVTATLPASTGSGARYRFAIKTVATSNNHIVKVANASDIMQGTVSVVDTDTAGTITAFATAADSDTVTLNRSTQGSIIVGEWLEFTDIVKNKWMVTGVIANTGNGATPFSAGVS